MFKLINRGILPGTVTQNPYDIGYLSVEASLKLVKGESIERNISSGVDIIIKGNSIQRLDFTRKVIGMN